MRRSYKGSFLLNYKLNYLILERVWGRVGISLGMEEKKIVVIFYFLLDFKLKFKNFVYWLFSEVGF